MDMSIEQVSNRYFMFSFYPDANISKFKRAAQVIESASVYAYQVRRIMDGDTTHAVEIGGDFEYSFTESDEVCGNKIEPTTQLVDNDESIVGPTVNNLYGVRVPSSKCMTGLTRRPIGRALLLQWNGARSCGRRELEGRKISGALVAIGFAAGSSITRRAKHCTQHCNRFFCGDECFRRQVSQFFYRE